MVLEELLEMAPTCMVLALDPSDIAPLVRTFVSLVDTSSLRLADLAAHSRPLRSS